MKWFKGLALWVRIAITIVAVVVVYFLIASAYAGIKHAIFGNPEVVAARGGQIVATEQGKAEANIADGTIQHVRERDVYREHVTNIVREGQGRVNNAWNGETVGEDVDAAGAATLCRVHNSLCRGTGAEEVQPLRQPVPRED